MPTQVVPIKEDPGIILKLELPKAVKLEDKEIFINASVTGNYIWCVGRYKSDLSNYP